MTLQEIKNNIARSFGCKGWEEYIEDMPIKDLKEDIEHVAILYAKQKCKEQREICAEKAELDYDSEDCTDAGMNESAFFVDKSSILNAPEPKFD